MIAHVAHHPARFTLTACTIVAVICIAYVQYTAAAGRDELCESGAATRQVLIDVTTIYAEPQIPPAGASDAHRHAIEAANAKAEQVRVAAVEAAAPALCGDGQPPASYQPPTGTTTP